MIDPAYRAAYEHGRRVVLDRREREARARYEAWERARQRTHAHISTSNDDRVARPP